MHFPATNRTSQAHALDPEVRRDALRTRAHCSEIQAWVEQPGDGVLAAKIFPKALLNRRLEAAPDSGPLFQERPCREAALGVFAVKQSARGMRLPRQTPVSAARAVELYPTLEHRGR